MHARLFLSTFALIFLAELGDKTQLAAMARVAAGEGDKWTIFWAASSALVLATLLAVLLGDVLARIVPLRYVKFAAGFLFLAFGTILLHGALLPEKALTVKSQRTGPMMGMALRLAAEFEAAAVEDYRKLAAANTDPQLQPLLEELVRAESDHLRRIREARLPEGESSFSSPEGKPPVEQEALFHDVAGGSAPILQHAIEHERATGRFYAELARSTHWKALRTTFALLAREEEQHVSQLLSKLKRSYASRNGSQS